MRCPPGTTTVRSLAREVIGARVGGLSFGCNGSFDWGCAPVSPRSWCSGPIGDPSRRSATMPRMDFEIPQDIADLLAQLDDFIAQVIKPLEEQDDNIRFFDHRREDARTDWERGGLPNEEW